MGRTRKVYSIGEALPGRLPPEGLACSKCWHVKHYDRFLTRPRKGRDGRWTSVLRSSCDNCLRTGGASRAGRRTAREAAPPEGYGGRIAELGEIAEETLGELSRKNAMVPNRRKSAFWKKKEVANCPKIPGVLPGRTTKLLRIEQDAPRHVPWAFLPEGARITPYRHAWRVIWHDLKGREIDRIAGW